MASLTGLQINNTYPGLIKTTDNAAIDGAPRILTDGEGNALPIQVSTAGTDFNGNVDFAAATVTGLPAAGVTSIIAGTGISIDQATGAVTVTNTIVDYDTTYDLAAAANGANIDLNLTGSDATVDTVSIVAGTNITLSEAAGVVTIDAASGGAAGLVNGTGTDTLKNADALVTTAAITRGAGDIALGNGASNIVSAATDTRPYGGGGIAIGDGAKANQTTDYAFLAEYFGGIAIGQGAEAETTSNNNIGIAIGKNAFAGAGGIAIGGGQTQNANADTGGIAIGYASKATVTDSVGILGTADGGYGSIAIGKSADANVGGFQTSPTVLGYNARGRALGSVAIGGGSQVSSTANTNCTLVGTGTLVAAGITDAGAFGQGITAGITGSVSVKELETQTVGGGITMYSPNGTAYKLTVTDAGALLIS
jgi:hypothetical protein